MAKKEEKISDIKISKYTKNVPEAFKSDELKLLCNKIGATSDPVAIVPYLDYEYKEITDSFKFNEMTMKLFTKNIKHSPIECPKNELKQILVKSVLNRAYELGEKQYLTFKEETNWDPNIQKTKTHITRKVKFKENPFKWIANLFLSDSNKYTVTDRTFLADMTKAERYSLAQRTLISKILMMSNYIFKKGRIGAGDTIIVNQKIASMLCDFSGFTVVASEKPTLIYPIGQIYGIDVWVDPNRRWDDNRILMFKRSKEQFGLGIILSYLSGSIKEKTRNKVKYVNLRVGMCEIGLKPENHYLLADIVLLDDIL